MSKRFAMTDVVTEFIEGLVETYPGLQYLDGFPEVIYFHNCWTVFFFPGLALVLHGK